MWDQGLSFKYKFWWGVDIGKCLMIIYGSESVTLTSYIYSIYKGVSDQLQWAWEYIPVKNEFVVSHLKPDCNSETKTNNNSKE